MEPASKDIIRVKDRLINVSLASGARWPAKEKGATLQPLLISVDIFHDVAAASATDDLELSINYSSISKKLGSALTEPSHTSYRSLEEVISRALEVAQEGLVQTSVTELKIKVVQLKAPLHCKEIGIESWTSRKTHGWEITRSSYFVSDFTCPAIIGVNDVERNEEQNVVANLSIDVQNMPLDRATLDFRQLTRSLWTGIGNSSYLTLEALTTFAAQEILAFLSKDLECVIKPLVTVAVAKPCALVYASASEVQVTRTFEDFQQVKQGGHHRAAIALGSNLGDPFHNIEYALQLLECPEECLPPENLGISPEVSVIDTSFLYETSPMYVQDQPTFINCACLIETTFEPMVLLKLLKAIELAVGRVPTVRNGPRVVDLDIIFYDDLILDTRPLSERLDLENLADQLVIPHPRLQEREFVLRPLNDMIPKYIHPVLRKSVGALLKAIPRSADEPPMQKVIPFPVSPQPSNKTAQPPATLVHWTYSSPPPNHSSSKHYSKSKTQLMATLNVTPDSFSDGSDHNTVTTALTYISDSVGSGASIIDIGGYSTRPGADFVGVSEEIERVVPTIEATRSNSDKAIREIPISVDTFRWEVAEAAIKAGANCINDVHAFTGRPRMYPDRWQEDEEALGIMGKMKEIARQYVMPVVLMHSRGDAGSNKDYSEYAYAEVARTPSVVEGVRCELGDKVDRIVKGKGGVRRWLVIVDPGIGFSKTLEGNLELLRHGAKVVEDVDIGKGENKRRNPLAGFPVLVGTSRKSFLGAILSKGTQGRTTAPKERVWATAATVACAVQQGAMVVRIHDIKEMADVVATSDALWA